MLAFLFAILLHVIPFGDGVISAANAALGPFIPHNHFVCHEEASRIQILYVYDQEDRLETLLPEIKREMLLADSVLVYTSSLRNKPLHLKFNVDENCQPIIEKIHWPGAGELAMGEFLYNLYVRKAAPVTKFLVFVETYNYAGFGSLEGDDKKLENLNQTNSGFAVVSANSISWYVILHEIFHTLGAVNSSAPNSDKNAHCYIQQDVMCYWNFWPVVEKCDIILLDCTGDNYFNPNPMPFSYLSQHWNTADSVYLTESTYPKWFLPIFADDPNE